jgi:hypothetical protein
MSSGGQLPSKDIDHILMGSLGVLECECSEWAIAEPVRIGDHHPNCKHRGEEKPFVRIGIVGSGSFLEPLETAYTVVHDMLVDYHVGKERHKVTLELVYMTQLEFESIPEFTGF